MVQATSCIYPVSRCQRGGYLLLSSGENTRDLRAKKANSKDTTTRGISPAASGVEVRIYCSPRKASWMSANCSAVAPSHLSINPKSGTSPPGIEAPPTASPAASQGKGPRRVGATRPRLEIDADKRDALGLTTWVVIFCILRALAGTDKRRVRASGAVDADSVTPALAISKAAMTRVAADCSLAGWVNWHTL